MDKIDFYLETNWNGKTCIRTLGVDYQTPLILFYEKNDYQIWHKPSRTVIAHQSNHRVSPACYIVIEVIAF